MEWINDKAHEDRLLELAIRKGIISREQIEQIEQERARAETGVFGDGRYGARTEMLIRNGIITEEILKKLAEELNSNSDAEPGSNEMPTLEPVTASSSTLDADRGTMDVQQLDTGNLITIETSIERLQTVINKEEPVKNWDRYKIVHFLGEGGMGRVYKALDPNLNRYVAIKFIRGDAAQLAQRFLQEARAQAKVEHEHICKIYEVGEVEGKLYIAMQYIEGKNLAQISKELTIEQKVKAMKEVAEAVHAAHRIGLIHRDIKPANVMMEKKEEGWHPYVMDFGLAKEMDAAGFTVSGMVVGTPWYMAPEQAMPHSGSLDRRTDVYSLGATLYELLAGKAPFAETPGIEVILKVIHDDPTALNRVDKNIPVDLETIVMKCMEKEMNRRYDSARALAEDLQRYLDGDVIQARPSTIVYRLSKKARKHKALVAVTLVAMVLILALIGYALYTKWQSYEQANLAHHFGLEIKEAETIMRLAAMLPMHDITRERHQVVEKIQQIESDMKEAGSIAYGPGSYDIGKGYLMLHDYYSAERYLQQAWDNGYREPDVAYALGKVMGARYQEELIRIEQEYSKSQQKEEKLKLGKKYREPALIFLKLAQGKVGMEAPEYLQALLAFYEKNYDAALKKVDRALQRVPWLYEAMVLKGDMHVAMGNEKRLEENYDEAMNEYNFAEQAYQHAIEIARSDPGGYEGLCDKRAMDIFFAVRQCKAPGQLVQRALQTCDEVLRINPASVSALTNESNAYKRWAQFLVDNNEDPREPALRSIQPAQQALRINPYHAYALLNMGVAYRIIAAYQIQHGLNPDTAFTKALENLHRALGINRNFFHAYNNLGMAYRDRGTYAVMNNEDPRSYYHQSIQYLEKTAEIDPNFVNAYENLCRVYNDMADWEARSGQDSQQSRDKAIAYARKIIGINPDNTIAALVLRNGN
jgi:eukaryotic-like serine/threonine-protein kinase